MSNKLLNLGRHLPAPIKDYGGYVFASIQRMRGDNFVSTSWKGHNIKFGYWDRITLGVANGAITNGKINHEQIPLEYFEIDRSHDGIIDIGAHFGIYTVVLATLNPKMEVHGFEPDDYNIRVLEKNLAINNLKSDRVHVHKNVVSDTSGSVNFYTDQSAKGTTSHTIEPVNQHNEYVPNSKESVSASEFCSEYQLNNPWVKVDAEGAELKILKDLFDAAIPDSVSGLVELHLNREEVTREKFNHLLDSYGYARKEIKEELKSTNPGYLIHPE